MSSVSSMKRDSVVSSRPDSSDSSHEQQHSHNLKQYPALELQSSTLESESIGPEASTVPHAVLQISHTQAKEEYSRVNTPLSIDGVSLDLPTLVAVAQLGRSVEVDEHSSCAREMRKSVELLADELQAGHSIYGVTTGFGGSADANTDEVHDLQVALLQMQLCGVLPTPGAESTCTTRQPESLHDASLASLSMPEPWVRAAMLVRINTLMRGHSAVRLSVIQSLVSLLTLDLVPLVPLRGSISASGDLCPLAYIAGALKGNPDVYVWADAGDKRRLLPSEVALQRYGMKPVQFGPKETLGVLNGTAFSAAVGGLAMYEANQLALLAQVLTAMGVEALQGSVESFDPYIASVRPHPGQQEAACNIRTALQGSKLLQEHRGQCSRSLRQDRYAWRTASQWLGPGLEDLLLATQQLQVELNSTTDNPLIDATGGRVLHGGNFQASSVTSSTEKTRLALQMIGKLLFAQSSELLDVKLSNGLPPNLAFDDPSLSYTLKGVDINMAAYIAELGFLANPVSSHVHSAEMGNQSLNSMALVSCRITHQAIEIVSLMASAYIYSLCQALDLRAMYESFFHVFRPVFDAICSDAFERLVSDETSRAAHANHLWTAFEQSWASTTTLDPAERCREVGERLQPKFLSGLLRQSKPTVAPIETAQAGAPRDVDVAHVVVHHTERIASTAQREFLRVRDDYAQNPDARPFLGRGAARIYTLVRCELGVPLHRGLVDYPDGSSRGEQHARRPSLNTGTWISRIYLAMRRGEVARVLGECI